MKYPIGVVVATYKRPELLKRCLRSLAQQTIDYNDYEIVVVCDGPDESSMLAVKEICRQYPGLHLQVHHTNSKQGPAAARNLGWKLADATLIAFTDDDCVPSEKWLAAYLQHYDNEKPDCTFTGKVIVPVSSKPTDYEKNTVGLETADFITANCCCPKNVLKQIGGFDPAYKTAWREDSDLHFNILSHHYPVKKVQEAIVIHPVRKASWGISLKEQKKSMFNALLYKKYPSYYRQMITRGPLINYYVMIFSFLSAVCCLFAGAIEIATVFFGIWLLLVLHFARKRLSGTSRSISHIAEILATSALIPFLSVFWTLYGSVKYKVFFL
jgi:GT2 family glycosyltransferase